ncbi:PVC-type heme-binding CxxCH protein [Rubripirellula reticaptiva]|uniref:Trehalose utilization n=1 Tax=Rubripirellula reticaptiva TaxID=2528013 RepID=A0A5C6FCM9_9BACT|nr:PVC-type heme-binding CxxCH protein [Rubripirellula reticaptiva]TWU57856.1 Trehalose utilization [Rubripirellula reticaptiva]
MNIKLLPLSLFLVAWIAGLPDRAAADADSGTIRVLFLGDTGRNHEPRLRCSELRQTLQDRGIALTYTDETSELTPKNLANFDAVLLFADIAFVDRVHVDALMNFVRDGGAFVPIHCASDCFRNIPEFVDIVGAQFKEHGAGVFRAQVARPEHPLMIGYGGFESWDETYVHQFHNDVSRTVLEYRLTDGGREPWTWIRHEGKGRVFYTAWGHDAVTWTNPGFQNLIERGIRWSVGRDPRDAGDYLADQAFPIPKIKPLQTDLPPFDFVDVGGKLPRYFGRDDAPGQPNTENLMQKPLAAEESLKHIVVPEGFHVELFASDPDINGKPICMAWDDRGRLWIAETIDYPNLLHEDGFGNDRIRICEDTDGDGRADRFTVFAENLSIPSAMAFSGGGVIVQNGTQTIFLRDSDNDDCADVRELLLSNWDLKDTHGGVSNFQYGLDNWIWGMQGYNQSEPEAGGNVVSRFRMGFFRMRPDASEIEFIRSTNNNTWGLGFSEEGFVFGSTANGNPSVYMPIANRYYERVQGWTPSLTLSSIADNHLFDPVAENIRQGDWQGGYTSATGHALYTAREYPQEYWNSVAFVNGPTGHLIGAFLLKRNGSDFSSRSDFNMLASDDEWTAPTMTEVGPDGQVWVADWYNYVMQHNPAPEGFETGRGGAYETELRDNRRGRIYRIVADDWVRKPVVDLHQVSPDEWVDALSHSTMAIRKHAQRLIVERGDTDVAPELIELVRDQTTDEIGLNVGAIHGLWTLSGLGLLDGRHADATNAAHDAMRHPSSGVRRNAVMVLPPTKESASALLDAELLSDGDRQVQLAAILAFSDFGVAGLSADTSSDDDTRKSVASSLLAVMENYNAMADRWIPDALTCAAAQYSRPFLNTLGLASELPPSGQSIIQRVAEHHARSEAAGDEPIILANLALASTDVLDSVIDGFAKGSSGVTHQTLDPKTDKKLQSVFERVSLESKRKLIRLASRWSSRGLTRYRQDLVADLMRTVHDSDESEDERVAAATDAIEYQPSDRDIVVNVFNEITPRTEPTLAVKLIRTMEASQWSGLGDEVVGRLAAFTPSARQAAFDLLLQRTESTRSLLDAARQGKVSLGELSFEQQRSLSLHPDTSVKRMANQLLALGGTATDPNRVKVLDRYRRATLVRGDIGRGKEIFNEHCGTCHLHGKLGKRVGPDLTGMAVHPKRELLTHILDPDRSVEGNYLAYTVLTTNGVVHTGMLAGESKAVVELIDAHGKIAHILRDEIDQLVASRVSIMPTGFENSIDVDSMADLLEFLVRQSEFVPIPLDRYATAISTKGMFLDDGPDHFKFVDWSPKEFKGVPFQLINPLGQSRPNVIMLNCTKAPIPSSMPMSVRLPCNMPASVIHFLSGVAGWGYPSHINPSLTMTVRLNYHDGIVEDHPLINGVHFADYISRIEVPGSEFAFGFEQGQQLRYLQISPRRGETIDSIDLLKGVDDSAPVVVAVTVQPIPIPVPSR